MVPWAFGCSLFGIIRHMIGAWARLLRTGGTAHQNSHCIVGPGPHGPPELLFGFGHGLGYGKRSGAECPHRLGGTVTTLGGFQGGGVHPAVDGRLQVSITRGSPPPFVPFGPALYTTDAFLHILCVYLEPPEMSGRFMLYPWSAINR